MVTRNSDEPALGRRSFLRSAALLAAAAPIVTEASLAHAAQTAAPPSGMALHGQSPNAPPSGAVLINANENPLGPSKAACDAIARVAPLGGRYDLNGETDLLTRTFAAQNGLKPEYVEVYAGSSEPLHYSVLAFTSPAKSFVTADPSYEAGMYAAKTSQAKVVKVPLTKDYAHDVKAMVAADAQAGVIYICNPNNPTGTVTTKQDIIWALENKPAGSILLVDEAYIHLTDEPDTLDLVAQGKDLIVLRTFSKIYGMAGIRCGFAVGRPDLLAKLKPFGQNAMPITGSAAARASLEDASLVPTRRKIIGDTRRDTIAWLKAGGYKVIGDPQTNCFMIDTGRNGKAVFAAMKAKNVLIGRTWPIWPNAVRVSVGTPEEMAKFKIAFKEVMDAKPTAIGDHVQHAELDYYAIL
ncbi:pyridoxal phosphate-dependent aminotransferase [Caulobacter segnis]|uniref:Aminotransferase class I and II n=2 Tax=Caulobacter segnis TaxID=88688 RepID=D5VMA0_CAUST|nr:pyridoxal phosphate-dependent aminotransferase [Caulobacter segnis]ADG11623.1 aminotransferase class I and II [Caulobacter segnis ATCC 21756]AVQ03273.1 pyridoxal phosphate-dependent aminotransferase [Caulobacter segnis]